MKDICRKTTNVIIVFSLSDLTQIDGTLSVVKSLDFVIKLIVALRLNYNWLENY